MYDNIKSADTKTNFLIFLKGIESPFIGLIPYDVNTYLFKKAFCYANKKKTNQNKYAKFYKIDII